MQTDGNLVVYTDGVARFASGTFSPGAAAVQQADGNFVVYAVDGTVLFTTGTASDSSLSILYVDSGQFRVLQAEGLSVAAVYGSAWGSSVVDPGVVLYPGDRRSAPGGVQLVLQTDGNLVEYVRGQAVLATATSSASGTVVGIMQTDGNFVLYSESVTDGDIRDEPVFSTGTAGFPGSVLVVQSDTNLVVYTPEGRPVYSALR